MKKRKKTCEGIFKGDQRSKEHLKFAKYNEILYNVLLWYLRENNGEITTILKNNGEQWCYSTTRQDVCSECKGQKETKVQHSEANLSPDLGVEYGLHETAQSRFAERSQNVAVSCPILGRRIPHLAMNGCLILVSRAGKK